MQSVEIPVVTQTRVSGDYSPSNSQWMIGDTTIIAHAVGLAVFKDVRILYKYPWTVCLSVCLSAGMCVYVHILMITCTHNAHIHKQTNKHTHTHTNTHNVCIHLYT